MELYQLRTFLTVAEEGHLTRAAEKLCTSQPAVSAQLRALEEECGIRLFDRTTKGMVLTEAGSSLREKARLIIDAAKDFKHHADNLRDNVAGELVIGLNNRPEFLRLFAILQKLSARHPGLTYRIVYGSSGVILQGLEEGSISVGFFEGACTSQKVDHHQLDEVDLRIIGPKTWEKDFARSDWKLLEDKPWIFVSPNCSYYRAIEHICHEQGLKLRPRFEVNEDLTVLGLVAGELGLTVCATNIVEDSPLRKDLFFLPHFQMTIPLSLGYLTCRAEDPAINAVREATLETWQHEEVPPVPMARPAAHRLPLPKTRTPSHR